MRIERAPSRWTLAALIMAVMVVVAGIPASATAGVGVHQDTPAGDVATSAKRDHAPDKAVKELFNTLGPWAVFLLLVAAGAGLHLPEDLIIIPAGWEVGTGDFPLIWTAIAAYIGVVGGDSGWFLLCRTWGSKLLVKRWFLKSVHPRRILTLKELLDRHGLWVLLVSRLIPGARTASVAVAGLTHLKWRVFLAVELPMAAFTVAAQISIGYFAAQGVLHSSPTWHWVTIGIGIGLLVIGVIAIAVTWRYVVKHNIRLPRARAAWLREVRGGSRAALRRQTAQNAAPPPA